VRFSRPIGMTVLAAMTTTLAVVVNPAHGDPVPPTAGSLYAWSELPDDEPAVAECPNLTVWPQIVGAREYERLVDHPHYPTANAVALTDAGVVVERASRWDLGAGTCLAPAITTVPSGAVALELGGPIGGQITEHGNWGYALGIDGALYRFAVDGVAGVAETIPVDPTLLTDIVDFDVGGAWGGTLLALRDDGTVLYMSSEQGANLLQPVPGLDDVVATDMLSPDMPVALTATGEVLTIGEDQNDDVVAESVPGIGDAVAIAAGSSATSGVGGFGLALRADGTVVQWGWDFNCWECELPPTTVPGLSNVTAIAAGGGVALAVVEVDLGPDDPITIPVEGGVHREVFTWGAFLTDGDDSTWTAELSPVLKPVTGEALAVGAGGMWQSAYVELEPDGGQPEQWAGCLDPETLFDCLALTADGLAALIGWIDPVYADADLQVAACASGGDWRAGCDPSTTTRLDVDPSGNFMLELRAPVQIANAAGLRIDCLIADCGLGIADGRGNLLFLVPYGFDDPHP
jgi:hypothetical protein